jgi:hypothetical protein
VRFLSVEDGGTLVVAIVAEGLPEFTGEVPAPMCSEIERAERVENARRGIWLDGMFIESERRVRNPAFDKRGEKTTTELKWRPCKTQDEADFVAHKVLAIARERDAA